MKHLGTQMMATERLTLRRFTPEDAESMFYNWSSDPEVTRYLTWEPQESVESTEAYLEQWESEYENSETYRWAIELNDTEQPIGVIEVISMDERIGSAEVSFRVGKEYWHHGYASEALTEIIRFLMGEAGFGRVWAKADVANVHAGEVMEKCGMLPEGVLKRAGWNHTGIADIGIYAKTVSAAVAEDTSDEDAAMTTHVTKVMDEDGKLRNVISDETMEYVGILAKLELSPEEAEAAKKDMADMLDYIDQLNELDTDGIEPMSHVFPVHNVFREDVVTNGDGSAATLANAPVLKDGGFKVPKTIGE